MTSALNQSGHDLDVWGGDVTTPTLIPTRGGIEPCLLKVDGACPPDCDECVTFARRMGLSEVCHES